ncbi:MAG: sulfatase-like hydrolase/transferase [Armatimonadetes bacterium]|nr:sulfatase-like hydrolase/transferase [Armatimonadota bacterium]
MSESLTRRDLLAGLAAASAAAAAPRAPRVPDRRPNVVYILIDDLRWDAFSHMGHPYVQTPNIDRLAREGARFERFFVSTSLCSPSRACFLTGCEPQRTGVIGNEATEYDHRLPTFPLLLQRAGYDTAYVGKWHQEPNANPRPGFDYWLSFKGQGEYLNPQLNENGRDFQRTGYVTDLLTEFATGFLRRRRRGPFCLCLCHKAVHGPFTPAERHKAQYPEAQLPEPPDFQDDLSGKPRWQRALAVRGTAQKQWRDNADKPVPDRLPPATWNPKLGLDYFRTLSAVDESVGTVLRCLEELRVLDDTVVVFTSDNGYFLGEHRRGDKRLAYEESIRIPFLVRYPRLAKPGSVVLPMGLNLDLCPTICDLCDVDPPRVVHGRSLRPLFADLGTRPRDWREDFLYQYFQERAFEGVPTIQAVRTERWKYVTAPAYPDAHELYDLEHDRYEMRNLADDPTHAQTRAALAVRLAQLVAAAEAPKLAPPPPPPPPKPETLLSYTFDQPGDVVHDASGKGRDGRLADAVQQTVDGRPALVFAGKGTVSLDPKQSPPVQSKPFWVRATVRADGDGVIVSHGGQSFGYRLELVAGKPVFTVRTGGEAFDVTGDAAVAGRWVVLAGVLANDGRLQVLVDGQVAGAAEPVPFVHALPNEGFTIGADLGSQVGVTPGKPFTGAIATMAVGIGAMPAGE